MNLRDRQALRYLLRTPRFWMTALSDGMALAVKFNAIPLTGRMHDAAFVALLMLGFAGAVALGLWQAPRESWTHEQKLRESGRRISLGLPPLEGYEHMLEKPPPKLPP